MIKEFIATKNEITSEMVGSLEKKVSEMAQNHLDSQTKQTNSEEPATVNTTA